MENQFMMNQMNNNFAMMNQMNNNFGMMNQMNNMFNMGMMYPMNNMINNEMMNQMISLQLNNQLNDNDYMTNNDLPINNSNNQEHLDDNTDLVRVCFLFGDREKYILIEKRSDYPSLLEKLISIMKSEGITLYRHPKPGEVIIRNSPNETLEFLLDRGVEETNLSIEIKKKMKCDFERFKSSMRIENGDKLRIHRPQIYGAGFPSINFVDVDEVSKTKKLEFCKNAPKLRKVSEGLNLFGKCVNSKCEAYNKEVIYKVGINIKFDYNLDRKEIKCPACSKNFLPSTTGFWKCEYQIKGEKFKDGDYKQIDLNGMETKGNDFEYYDTDENGKVEWSELKIFACYRQEMKYKKS